MDRIAPDGGNYERPASEGGGQTSTYAFDSGATVTWRASAATSSLNSSPSGTSEYHMTMDPGEKRRLGKDPWCG